MLTSPKVYLAGPILGCTQGEATNWRQDVADRLAVHNIIGISPLRCEPIHGEVYTADYPDPRFGVPRAIAAKNKFDVMNCDMGLYVIPKPGKGVHNAWDDFINNVNQSLPLPSLHDAFIAGFDARKLHSFGTLGELFWANMAGKQTILVTDDPFIRSHPVIDSAANWKLDTVEEAIDVIVGVLGGYAGGKNV